MNTEIDSRIETLERRQTMIPHEIVSQKESLVARKELLTKEKELTKLRDQLNEERRGIIGGEEKSEITVCRTDATGRRREK
jgi:predicted dithiol-disulfide oxidoreductase (DUF899 family)